MEPQDYVYILQERTPPMRSPVEMGWGTNPGVIVKGEPLVFLTAYDLALFLGMSPDSPSLVGTHSRGDKTYMVQKAAVQPSANRKAVAPGQTKN